MFKRIIGKKWDIDIITSGHWTLSNPSIGFHIGFQKEKGLPDYNFHFDVQLIIFSFDFWLGIFKPVV